MRRRYLAVFWDFSFLCPFSLQPRTAAGNYFPKREISSLVGYT
jgi:hypothetical protein